MSIDRHLPQSIVADNVYRQTPSTIHCRWQCLSIDSPPRLLSTQYTIVVFIVQGVIILCGLDLCDQAIQDTRARITYQVIVVVLTLTCIIKSVVTGLAPVTLELRNTLRKKNKPEVVHAYIIADATHASARKVLRK